jgi:hypothetical protein
MRTLFALVAGFVIWNVSALAALDRPSAAEAPKAGASLTQPFGQIIIHGRLGFIAACLPRETGAWFISAGEQSFSLSLVNVELIEKAHALGNKPVVLTGYCRNGELIVESLAEDTRENPTPSAEASLRGKLVHGENGWSMEVEGQVYVIDFQTRPDLEEKAESLKDSVVVAGAVEIRSQPDGTGRIVHVNASSLHDGQLWAK